MLITNYMDIKHTEAMLNELRKKWIENPDKRSIYELQAKPLKSAIRIYYENHPQEKLI